MVRWNRRGSQYVEGALVFPLIVLILISFLGGAVYLLHGIRAQVRVQADLLAEKQQSQAIYEKIILCEEVSSSTGGFVDQLLKRSYEESIYVTDEATVIRLGEFVYGEDE